MHTGTSMGTHLPLTFLPLIWGGPFLLDSTSRPLLIHCFCVLQSQRGQLSFLLPLHSTLLRWRCLQSHAYQPHVSAEPWCLPLPACANNARILCFPPPFWMLHFGCSCPRCPSTPYGHSLSLPPLLFHLIIVSVGRFHLLSGLIQFVLYFFLGFTWLFQLFPNFLVPYISFARLLLSILSVVSSYVNSSSPWLYLSESEFHEALLCLTWKVLRPIGSLTFLWFSH